MLFEMECVYETTSCSSLANMRGLYNMKKSCNATQMDYCKLLMGLAKLLML